VVEIAEVFPRGYKADLMKACDRSGEPLRHPKQLGEAGVLGGRAAGTPVAPLFKYLINYLLTSFAC
jgi:hypothetical protein